MLYVTHDQTEAMTLADRIGVLERGVLVQVGTPQQIYRDPVQQLPSRRAWARRRINLLPRAVVGNLDGRRRGTVGVRPDATRLPWPTATTAATSRRWCGASSTWRPEAPARGAGGEAHAADSN